MRRVLQWINANKQWVFQGIGVAVLTLLVAFVSYWLGGRSEPTAVTNSGRGQFNGKKLQGPSEINASFERIAANGSKRIQLLIQVLGDNPHLPQSLAETIAIRIADTKRLGVPIKYDPILVFNSENPFPGFVKGALSRADVFSKHGVSEFVRPRYLDQKHNLGADILIVDGKHVLIALNTVPGADSMQVGVLFEDQPEVAAEFSAWFDQVVMPNTKYFDEWLRTQQLSSSTPRR